MTKGMPSKRDINYMSDIPIGAVAAVLLHSLEHHLGIGEEAIAHTSEVLTQVARRMGITPSMFSACAIILTIEQHSEQWAKERVRFKKEADGGYTVYRMEDANEKEKK